LTALDTWPMMSQQHIIDEHGLFYISIFASFCYFLLRFVFVLICLCWYGAVVEVVVVIVVFVLL